MVLIEFWDVLSRLTYIFVLTKQLCIKTVFDPQHKVALHTYMTDIKYLYDGY